MDIKMDAPMKQAAAIIIGALLIASALVFQSYRHRYEVAGGMGGLFVHLDSRTGQLSPCVLVQSGGLDNAINSEA